MNSTSLQDIVTFGRWIYERKIILLLSVILILGQFMGLRLLFPFPNFLPDSYSYLEAAYNNQFINVWPIGYSKFLRLFSCFTKSHVTLILFQYLLLYGSILYFIFSTAYLLTCGKWLFRIMIVTSVLNPLIFFISNFISSDAIFAALSIIWLTQLFWILHKPSGSLFVSHALALLLAFTFRYNAIYYPIISIITILFSQSSVRQRAAGVTSIILLIGGFMAATAREYKTVTGSTQFSAFGGWQLASNALYAYGHVAPDAPSTVPPKFKALQKVVFAHNDSLSHIKYRPDGELGIYYLWEEGAPLKRFMHVKYKKDSTTNSLARWTSMAPLYSDYGLYLIYHHPGAFIRHYLLPNMKNYYVPPIEFLGIFNLGTDKVDPIAKDWFSLKSNKISRYSGGILIKETQQFPVVLAVINLLYVLSLLAFVILGGHKKMSRPSVIILWYFLIIWLCNFGFSVLASPIVMRYQVFPFVTTLVFLLILLHFIIGETKTRKGETPSDELDIFE